MALQFNAIPTGLTITGLSPGNVHLGIGPVLWDGPRKIAYVGYFPFTGDFNAGYSGSTLTAIDFSSGSPVVTGSIVLQDLIFAAPPVFGQLVFGELLGYRLFINADPQPVIIGANVISAAVPYNSGEGNSCIDVNGTIWALSYYNGTEQGGIWYIVSYDAASGAGQAWAALTSIGADPIELKFAPAIWSCLVDGVSYILLRYWIYTITGPHDSFSGLAMQMAMWPASAGPANQPVATTLTFPQVDYMSVPVFDNQRYAYFICNGKYAADLTGSGDNSLPGFSDYAFPGFAGSYADDGSFFIVQIDLSGGSASISQSWGFSNGDQGRGLSGLFNPLNGNIIIFTTNGAVQQFNPVSGLLTTVAPTGTFAPYITTQFRAAVDDINFPLAIPYLISPDTLISGQVNNADTLNCFICGLAPNAVESTVQVTGVDFPVVKASFRRLNLGNFSFLDDHTPPFEWAGGDTNPADCDIGSSNAMQESSTSGAGGEDPDLATTGFIFAPEINSLLWLSADITTLYQLIWPNKGRCHGGNRPNLWVT